jgi:hypothetical protein
VERDRREACRHDFRQSKPRGPTVSSAAAPYMPSPKKAEWPNETMPVQPIRMSEDTASRP